jgi:hypothetical protein
MDFKKLAQNTIDMFMTAAAPKKDVADAISLSRIPAGSKWWTVTPISEGL